MTQDQINKCQIFLEKLCLEIPERCVGSEGNRLATTFFEQELLRFGWATETEEFDAIDWKEQGATLIMPDGSAFNVLASPYSLPFSGTAMLVEASTKGALESMAIKDKLVLLHGEIAKEQLMPKNFVFYNPEEHQEIIRLLERGEPAAVICATGRNAALAGGVYPFPLIEDGDFDIPSVYMTAEEGMKLMPHLGMSLHLESRSQRIPAKGYNVIGIKGAEDGPMIVVSAHIDAKKGTPGAIDNATGVAVMLLLAELLKDYDGEMSIELVAFNGEDYYAVPGQMTYIGSHREKFDRILLNINIDGAGYREGPTAFSLFDLPAEMHRKTCEVIEQFPGITEGVQWPQGDHSIFLQQGIPAIAVSSKWFIDNIANQDITHTSKDNAGIVDCRKLTEIASALNLFIRKL
jgi:aminopeptidase YwaD